MLQALRKLYLDQLTTISTTNGLFNKKGSEGPALQYDGSNMLVHNNAFLYNDWVGHGNLGTVMDKAKHGEFSQNSLIFNGVAHGLRYTGRGSVIHDNYFEGQCWGLIQSDGASIQVEWHLSRESWDKNGENTGKNGGKLAFDREIPQIDKK